ncbi:helix-turn-helix domain-containing protein [Chroococcus sp. FPU101]|uniref:helix-turn-helix domain-containing protein n=1 Tax=Chroococcus sp. FPU101 TaxID=1974212 RepID=UPI001A90C624|nr:helix-turn-helix domain-containing protein [Chroococcus sp. FPU101]GFE72215.1 hypothetical protein CFPU101_48250 [Chroococcus sp. FPU101]
MPLGKGKYKVSAYLSDEELELLESLSQTWQCNKSQAVIRAIKTLASNPSNSNESHYNSSNSIRVTRDELEEYLKPMEDHLNEVKKDVSEAITLIQNQLSEFDKGFQSWGSVVHDHDRILSEGVATKSELHKAIAFLKNEIEEKRNTFNSSQTDDEEDEDEDAKSSQGLTKASLDPIFEPYEMPPRDALTQTDLAKRLGVNQSTVSRHHGDGDNDEHFKQWSKGRDPQGKSWKCIGFFETPHKSKYFVPC